MQIDPTAFPENGLYLIFPDGKKLELTPQNIHERAMAVLSDPTKIPEEVKKAQEFELCDICPKKGSGDTCHAIRPVLAFWENLDQHFSYDRVTAVYRGRDHEKLLVAETDLQHALQYLSILCLMSYCEMGRQYWKYFAGVHPLMETKEVVARVYLNMFWFNQGDLEKTRSLINQFHKEISTTTRCQVDRIRMFCKHDPFVNALVITQVAAAFLSMSAEKMVQETFDEFAKSTSL